jgi:hypothetical protein
MTLRTPPSWLQNGSHPAENDRLTTQALWATTGIINSSSLAVTQNSPVGMSVIVAGGWAAIVGTTQANMGTYVGYNDAPVVVTITTANPTNPRIDLLCMTVQDAYYTGSSNNVIFQVVAGTPAGSPVVPSVPANSIALAEVAVAAGALSINNGNITDRRVLTTTNIPEVGDISAVVAGTGLSGGGTSGSVTLAINTAVTADLTTAQTLTNKTISAASNTLTGVATLTGAETLTNKTLTTPVLTAPLIDIGINAKTAAYTTLATDDGQLITVTSSSTANVTLAASLYNTGSQITVARMGTGAVSIVGDTGVTVVSTGVTASTPALRAQYSTATAILISTNSWLVVGDIT